MLRGLLDAGTRIRFASAFVCAIIIFTTGSVAGSASKQAAPRGVVVSEVAARNHGSWLEAATLAGDGRHRVTPRSLKGERRADFDPAISPDRSTVAFLRARPSGPSLWLVGIDG